MAEAVSAQLGKFVRGISVRQVRLACGLVLFAYLVSHFVNHALGNVSTDALAPVSISTPCSGNSFPSRSSFMPPR